MESKETRIWQNEEALKRYRIIAPLLDPNIDEDYRCLLRMQIAQREGKSVRTLYRYEKQYREEHRETLKTSRNGRFDFARRKPRLSFGETPSLPGGSRKWDVAAE